MKKPHHAYVKPALAGALLLGSALQAQAAEIHNQDGKSVEFNVEAMAGLFSTDENYIGTQGGNDWQEAYIKADLVGRQSLTGGSVYGGLGVIGLGTWGDGDAGGYTNGDEREFRLENAFVGWQSESGLLDLSVGRQNFMLGDGFLIAGDAISLGNLDNLGLPDAGVNRGGAYYLAGQKSFDNTAILRLDPEGPLRGDLFWLQSDNPYHQDTELGGINLELVDDAKGTLGLSYLKVLDVEAGTGLGLWDQRDGMDVVSLRGQGSLGVENLFLSFEYVDQSGGDTSVKNKGNAWYVEAGWTFADLPWTPNLNYRYAEFSGDDSATTDNEAFDPLFFGFTRGFGTWFQGEVASNYAGPANSGNTVNRLELTLQPREDLTLGAQYWDFGKEDDAADLSGTEVDLYALWTINDNWVFSPMVGIYNPDGSAVIANQGNDDTNLYMQAVLMYFY
ncbi:alginate export family protein [Neptuniibacter halophilus]|uniref:alginate export family protein n=1 Tax=Neptuniibacter halophilus TaxID=651666 RepID=UPI002573DE60|nr:alginate export family protein [Neptuniibacter halophilus]